MRVFQNIGHSKYSILVISYILASNFVLAQSIPFQIVITDTNGRPFDNKNVNLRITIKSDTTSSVALYQEVHPLFTNDFGLVSSNIGDGILSSISSNTSFTDLNLPIDEYFINTEVDTILNFTFYSVGWIQYQFPIMVRKSNFSDTSAYTFVTDTSHFSFHSDSTNFVTGIDQIGSKDSSNQNEIELPSNAGVGDLFFWDGSTWKSIPVGVNGEILRMLNGVPSWTTLPNKTVDSLDVYSPTTGEIWMDRNLGASRVAVSSSDTLSYGYLYQWGRSSDGHQSRNSGTTTFSSFSHIVNHGDFIYRPYIYYPFWYAGSAILWQGVFGVNNPCPTGYRIPSNAEWHAEIQSWGAYPNSQSAFLSPLRLPVAGGRDGTDGLIYSEGNIGYYWTSTMDLNGQHVSYAVLIAGSYIFEGSSTRANGFSVRCIKH